MTYNYKIKTNGIIKEGTAQYILDEPSGTISYHAEIVIGLWIFSHSKKYEGKISPPLSLLLSNRIIKAGQIISDGDYKIEITAVTPATSATIAISRLTDPDLVGTGLLDLSGKYITAKTATIHDVVTQMPITIELLST